MISRELARKYYLNGLMYGYPICCIEQFILDCNNDTTLKRISMDGYIPCDECEKEFLEDMDKRIDELLKGGPRIVRAPEDANDHVRRLWKTTYT